LWAGYCQLANSSYSRSKPRPLWARLLTTTFIDKIFKNPEDKEKARAALFQKLDLRNRMHNIDEKVPPAQGVITPFLEGGYDPANPSETPINQQLLAPAVNAPNSAGSWQGKTQQLNGQPLQNPPLRRHN
jgi:hypothetical protein